MKTVKRFTEPKPPAPGKVESTKGEAGMRLDPQTGF